MHYCAMIELELPIGILPAACDMAVPAKAKKADVGERCSGSPTSAYSLTSPPGKAGLPFI